MRAPALSTITTASQMGVAMIEALVLTAVMANGPDEPLYRNPAKPTKVAAKLRDSGYRGSHYSPRHEPYRKCVMARESGGNYKANGPYGSGAYQFIQSTWNVYAERARKPEWVGVRPYLAPPTVQDEIFWLAANPKPKVKGLEGKHHWSVKWALTIGKKVRDC